MKVKPIAPGEVQLWYTSVRQAETHAQNFRQILNEDELQRAARFRVELARQRFVAGRAMLRLLLGRLTDSPPAELRFSLGDHGKPILETEGPNFNLAHSGDTIVMAAATEPIGVDVEELRELPNVNRLARRICTTDELEFLTLLPKQARGAALLRLWTCKEAVLKGIGSGISGGLRSVEIFLSPKAAPLLLSITSEKNSWNIQSVPLPVNAVCTVAVCQSLFNLEVHPFPWAEEG